ncbi:hypothetical protein BRC86_03315 [Halobacteriales archaeon QS_3_64_16]|nr:MAG: hypothetical protein BRC86_03315 [Halobacteriales archaeon QS_3_64_16]
MDAASPIDARTAGRAAAPGTPGTFGTAITAHDSITLATPFTRDWRTSKFASFGRLTAFLGTEAEGVRSGRRARYRSPHCPSATGEGRAS